MPVSRACGRQQEIELEYNGDFCYLNLAHNGWDAAARRSVPMAEWTVSSQYVPCGLDSPVPARRTQALAPSYLR